MSTALEILARMAEAMETITAMPRLDPYQRMHPDDINEVRERFGVAETTEPFRNIYGLMIIPDETAPRLPRIHHETQDQ